MASWMDFIGKSYYTIDKFIAEAKKYGVTRRIGTVMLDSMSWGDEVICLQKEKGLKSYSVFMVYPITRIVGISEEARAIMADEDELQMQLIDDEHQEVARECGSYETVGTYAVDVPLVDIAKRLKQLHKEGIDVGKLMIGCYPQDVSVVTEPYPLLDGFEQRQGFRPYNAQKFWKDVNMAKLSGKKRVKMHGTYYLTPELTEESDGFIETVEGYTRKEEMEKEEKLKAQLVLL